MEKKKLQTHLKDNDVSVSRVYRRDFKAEPVAGTSAPADPASATRRGSLWDWTQMEVLQLPCTLSPLT